MGWFEFFLLQVELIERPLFTMDGPWQQLSYVPPLNSKEAALYANLWQAADVESKGWIEGPEAVEFLEKSKLNLNILRQIWSLSTPVATMNRDQFYVALRFVALAQNGAELSQCW